MSVSFGHNSQLGSSHFKHSSDKNVYPSVIPVGHGGQ